MSTLAEIATYLIRTLGSLYLLLVLLRFLFQLVRADFYNPISQFVAKATNPLLMPLLKIIPGLFGVDTAALVLAPAIQCVLFHAVLVLAGFVTIYPLHAIGWALVGVVSMVLSMFFCALISSILASWVALF